VGQDKTLLRVLQANVGHAVARNEQADGWYSDAAHPAADRKLVMVSRPNGRFQWLDRRTRAFNVNDLKVIFLQELIVPRLVFLLILMSAAAAVCAKATRNERAIHVDERGDDRANGLSADQAVRTLRRARDLMRLPGGPKTALLSGRFELMEPVSLGAADVGTRWRSLPNRPASIIGIDGAAMAFQVHGADGVSFQALRISGFATDGLRIAESRNAKVIGNIVNDIRSVAWSQAAIHLVGNVSGARVIENIVDDADYAGIAVTTNRTSRVDNLIIARNTVRRTCRQVKDCGAIYISDRGRRSRGSVIEHNIVDDVGPTDVGGRGIYLDDWASWVHVRNNRISGRGAYGIQIHGGSSNAIKNNLVDAREMSHALYIQPVDGQAPTTMYGNVVRRNRFITDHAERSLMKLWPTDQAARIPLTVNEQCAPVSVEPSELVCAAVTQ